MTESVFPHTPDFGWARFLTIVVTVLAVLQLAFRKAASIPAGAAFLRSVGVLLVLGVFTFLVMISSNDGRTPARATICGNNLKQIVLAMHTRSSLQGHLLPPVIEEEQKPPRSWRVELLSYMDDTRTRKDYVDSQSWDSPANAWLRPLCPYSYQCPSVPKSLWDSPREMTAYAMPTGPHAFGNGRKWTIEEIPDGAANTIMLVEACGRNLVWLEPRDVEVNEQNLGINQPGGQPGYSRSVFSTYHRSAANVALADGSVRRVNEKTDPQVLRALLTVDGGEAAAEDFR